MNPLPIIDPAVNKLLCSDEMGVVQHFSARDAADSLLGWWQDAGSDVAVADEPADWLGKSVSSKPAKLVTDVTPKALLPQTHNAFVAWLVTADIVEAGPPPRRLGPVGDPKSDLMVLADFPDLADVDARQLLSGPIGNLFDKMLSAVGRSRSTVYLATLCPGRPPSGRLSVESIEDLAEIARRHVALVAPKWLWLMGSAASRAILGIDDAAAKGKLHNVNLNGAKVSVIATAHPRFFEGSKTRKAAAWAEMQRLIPGDIA